MAYDKEDDELNELIARELECINLDGEDDLDEDLEKNLDETENIDYEVSFSNYLSLLHNYELQAKHRVKETECYIENINKVHVDHAALLKSKLEAILEGSCKDDAMNIHSQVLSELKSEEESEEKKEETIVVEGLVLDISRAVVIEEIVAKENEARIKLSELRKQQAEDEEKNWKVLETKRIEDENEQRMFEAKREKRQDDMEKLQKKMAESQAFVMTSLEEDLTCKERRIEARHRSIKESIQNNYMIEKERLKKLQDELNRNELIARTKAAILIQKNFRRYCVQKTFGCELKAMKTKRMLKEKEKRNLLQKQEDRRRIKERTLQVEAKLQKEKLTKKEKTEQSRSKNQVNFKSDEKKLDSIIQAFKRASSESTTTTSPVETNVDAIEESREMNRVLITNETTENSTSGCTTRPLQSEHQADCVEHRRDHEKESTSGCTTQPLQSEHQADCVEHRRDHEKESTSGCTTQPLQSEQQSDCVEHRRDNEKESNSGCTTQPLQSEQQTDCVEHRRDHEKEGTSGRTTQPLQSEQQTDCVEHRRDHEKEKTSGCTTQLNVGHFKKEDSLKGGLYKSILKDSKRIFSLKTNELWSTLSGVISNNEFSGRQDRASPDDIDSSVENPTCTGDVSTVSGTVDNTEGGNLHTVEIKNIAEGSSESKINFPEPSKNTRNVVEPATMVIGQLVTLPGDVANEQADMCLTSQTRYADGETCLNHLDSQSTPARALFDDREQQKRCSETKAYLYSNEQEGGNKKNTSSYPSGFKEDRGFASKHNHSASDVLSPDLCQVYYKWKSSSTGRLPSISKKLLNKIEFIKQDAVLMLEKENYDSVMKKIAECNSLEILLLDQCDLASFDGFGYDLVFLSLTASGTSSISLSSASLTILHLATNQLTTTSFLKGMVSLVALNLSHNNITRLSGLKDCCNLQYLNVDNNNIVSLKGLKNHPYLNVLSCRNNAVVTASEIDECNLLVELDLSGNNLTQIPRLKNNTLLQRLTLDLNSITSLSDLSKFWLPLLQTISLAGNSLQNLPSMSNLMLLSSLNVESNLLSHLDVFHNLTLCQNLKTISVKGNPLANGEDYCQLLHNMLPWLESMDGNDLQRAPSQEHGERCTCNLCGLLSHQMKHTTEVWCEQVDTLRKALRDALAHNQIWKLKAIQQVSSVVTSQYDCWIELRELTLRFLNDHHTMFERNTLRETTNGQSSMSVNEASENRKREAAIKLQSLYRGYKVRLAYLQLQQSRDLRDDDDEFAERVDLSDFDFDETALDCIIPPTPTIFDHEPLLPPIFKESQYGTVTVQAYDQAGVKEAWATPLSSSRTSTNVLVTRTFDSSPEENMTSSLDANSVTSDNLRTSTDNMANEWGFHNEMTAALMLKRAKRMGAHKRRTPLNSDERLQLFKKSTKLPTSVSTQRRHHLERQSYFTCPNTASPKLEENVNQMTYSWVCDQAVFHRDRAHELLQEDDLCYNDLQANWNQKSYAKGHSREPINLPPLPDDVLAGRPPSFTQSDIHNPKPPLKPRSSSVSVKARKRILMNTTHQKSHSAPSPLDRTEPITRGSGLSKEEKWKTCSYR